MKLTFLGTSCMVPTKERNVSSLYLEYKGEGILFDCGEGTQRQMNMAGIKRTKIKKILISHWHGDHVSGLIGLIQTIGNDEFPPTLRIYGPKDTKKRMDCLLKTCIFDQQVNLDIVELEPKGSIIKIYENQDYCIYAADLSHKVPCIGFSFTEKEKRRIKKSYLKKHNIPEGHHLKDLQKGSDIIYKGKKVSAIDATYVVPGKKISYIADTVPCKGILMLSEDADIMVSESAYTSDLSDKAEKYNHMTAKDAAQMANQAGVKKLVLTHFSQRYKNTLDILEEAENYFSSVVCAEDFMKISLK